MSKLNFHGVFIKILIILVLYAVFASGCLITNCPKGGKRSYRFGLADSHIKQCISCGLGGEGQCFGPNICCGSFGCLFGTKETLRCKREGMFDTMEPCIAGISNCRRHNGRCASDGICCSQETCITDNRCQLGPKHNDEFAAFESINFRNIQSDLFSEK